jgi:hypothetical protein
LKSTPKTTHRKYGEVPLDYTKLNKEQLGEDESENESGDEDKEHNVKEQYKDVETENNNESNVDVESEDVRSIPCSLSLSL